MEKYIIANKGTKLNKMHFLYGLSVEGRKFYKNASQENKMTLLRLLVENNNISSQDMINILIKK